jgi:invasion protein IalB
VAGFGLPVLEAGAQEADYERRGYGDWIVECSGASEEAECQLYQRILTQDPQVVALAVALHWKGDAGSFDTQIALPLNVDLRQPARLRIDEDYSIDLPWSRCNKGGCLIEGSFGPNLIGEMLQGQSAFVSVFHVYDGEIPIPLSLAGFEDAVRAVVPADVFEELIAQES